MPMTAAANAVMMLFSANEPNGRLPLISSW